MNHQIIVALVFLLILRVLLFVMEFIYHWLGPRKDVHFREHGIPFKIMNTTIYKTKNYNKALNSKYNYYNTPDQWETDEWLRLRVWGLFYRWFNLDFVVHDMPRKEYRRDKRNGFI